MRFQNTSAKQIVAIELGLVSFNIWNEFIDRTSGVGMKDLPPQKADSGTWVDSAYGDFAFLTGVAYVRKVRFDDGEIWIADEAAVVTEMQKIEKDFDAARLKPKDPTNQ